MFGKEISWTCLDCGTRMTDRAGVVSQYRVNGVEPCVMLKCDKCGLIHYVKEDGSICFKEETAQAEFVSVCCY